MARKFLTAMFLFLAWASFCEVKAQKTIQTNLKFGNPTKEEMELKVCPYDSSAKAMVLCDLTEVRYVYDNVSFKVEYTVKKRIKILSQEGVDAANVSIPYYESNKSGNPRESIRSLKATAYNLVNGKVVKTKMGNDLVFNERLDKKRMLTKFTVPQVKAGTVIEYSYLKSSDFFSQIDTWYAQSDLPTLYTSLDISIPIYFSFSVDQTGDKAIQSRISSSTQKFFNDGEPTELKCYVFKGENLPALKGDAFVWSPSTYANKVDFELRNISIPGAYFKNFTASWSDIDKLLMDDDDFGDRIRRSNPLKDEMAAARLDTISDFDKKVAATVLLLKKYVKWNGEYALFGNPSRNVLKEGKANNADINFILMNMLKSLNIQTVPVVLRTRDKGTLPLTHPSLESLNTFVVGVVKNDSTTLFVDGSAEQGYLNVLPPVLLTTAHVVNGTNINLMGTAAAKEATVVKVQFTSDGKLVGSMNSKYSGIASLLKKKRYLAAKDSVEYVKDLADRMELTINRYQLKNRRKYSPECAEYIEFEKDAEMGDVIYLSPIFDLPFKDVPFKTAERSLPVEFDSPMVQSYNSTINLPDGYSLEELPKTTILRSPDKALSFKLQSQLVEGVLHTTYTFSIRKYFFMPAEYTGLKAFFEEVTNALKAVVVLKKN